MFWSTRRAADLEARYENVVIDPSAHVADDVEIGPFTCIGPRCRVDTGTVIHNNVTLAQNVHVGKDNEIFSGAVVGGLPQDKKYRGESSRVEVGDGNSIRENVTVNSGTRQGNGLTRIGNRNLIMAGSHIAHDCILEDDIVMANNVLLGGHVYVERCASFGGLAAVHHFVTVGEYAFVGGLTRVAQDVPPFMLLEGNPSRVWAINRVGLKRRSFSSETMDALKVAHRMLFRSGKPRAQSCQDLLDRFPHIPEIAILCNFLHATELNNYGRARQPLNDDES